MLAMQDTMITKHAVVPLRRSQVHNVATGTLHSLYVQAAFVHGSPEEAKLKEQPEFPSILELICCEIQLADWLTSSVNSSIFSSNFGYIGRL